MSKSDKENKTATWVDRIGKHPFIIFAGFVIAVIALIVMIVLFFISQTERELVYAVNPVKTKVVTMGQATGLEVIHNRVELGDVDITAAQVAIWNSGDESIRKENVLKEVVIYTKPSVRILEASISNYSRELDIIKFNIIEAPELLEIGKVPVSWSILETGDGATVQLIYLGSTDVQIFVEGLIEGCGDIKRVGREVKIKTPAEQFKSAKIGWWIYLMWVSFISVFSYSFGRDAYRAWKRKHIKLMFLNITICVVVICGMSVFLWYYLSKGPLEPPFGF